MIYGNQCVKTPTHDILQDASWIYRCGCGNAKDDTDTMCDSCRKYLYRCSCCNEPLTGDDLETAERTGEETMCETCFDDDMRADIADRDCDDRRIGL